jgi:hypothetical protein
VLRQVIRLAFPEFILSWIDFKRQLLQKSCPQGRGTFSDVLFLHERHMMLSKLPTSLVFLLNIRFSDGILENDSESSGEFIIGSLVSGLFENFDDEIESFSD